MTRTRQYLPFTSGTTGIPKGVLHSDNTLLATARMMARDWHLHRAVLYTLSPLSHNLGLGALITALAGGGEVLLHDLPRNASLVDRLEEVGAEFLFGVPTHAIDLLAEMRARGARRLGKVRRLPYLRRGVAAGPWSRALMEYGIVPQSGYGMTETCSHQYTRPDDQPALHRWKPAGEPAPVTKCGSGARTIGTSKRLLARSAKSAAAAPA